MKLPLFVFALAFLTLGAPPRPAAAATASTSFGVTATVEDDCLVSLTAVKSRNYFSALANADAVSLNCTKSTSYNVGLNVMPTTGVLENTTGIDFGFVAYSPFEKFNLSVKTARPSSPATADETGSVSSWPLVLHDLTSTKLSGAAGAYVTVMVSY